MGSWLTSPTLPIYLHTAWAHSDAVCSHITFEPRRSLVSWTAHQTFCPYFSRRPTALRYRNSGNRLSTSSIALFTPISTAPPWTPQLSMLCPESISVPSDFHSPPPQKKKTPAALVAPSSSSFFTFLPYFLLQNVPVLCLCPVSELSSLEHVLREGRDVCQLPSWLASRT